MKRLTWVMLVVVALSLVALRGAAAPAFGAGIPAAGVKMENVDGRTLSIADVVGPHGTLVIFSCNHCPWVRAWEDRIIAAASEAAKRGVGVIASRRCKSAPSSRATDFLT